METAYHVDPQRELILVRPTGRFSETTFIELCRAIYDDPEREPHFSALWDTRAIDELIMDASVIPMYKNFLSENEHRVAEGRIAIVTDKGMAETFAKMLTEVVEAPAPTYRVFHGVEPAAEWLGVSAEELAEYPVLRDRGEDGG